MFWILLTGLVAYLACADSKTVNINDIVDLKLELANRLSAASNSSTVDYGTGFIYLAQYEGAVGIGLDSLYRTGDSEMRFNGNSITYVYNIGQNILATFFRKLTFQDKVGSGYYRAHNNSLEYSYTVTYRGASCSVRLETLKLTLDNVEAYLQDNSWSSNDDVDFNTFIQDHLLSAFNSKLEAKSDAIEESLETVFCQKPNQEQPTQGLDILRQFLFE